MAPNNILFLSREIVPFYYGGIGTLFMSLAKFARQKGHEVSFLTQRRDNFDLQTYKKFYGDIPVYFVDGGKKDDFVDYSPSGGVINTFDLAYSFSVAETFEKLNKEIEADLLFTADYGAEAFILQVKKRIGDFSGTRIVVHLSGALREIIKTYHRDSIPTGAWSVLLPPPRLES